MSLEGQEPGAAAAKVSRRLIYRPISPPYRVRFSGASHLTDDIPTKTGARVKTSAEESVRGVTTRLDEKAEMIKNRRSMKRRKRADVVYRHT